MGIGFLFQLFLHHLKMPVDVRPFCQHLELHLSRRDLQIGDKGIDDPSLFLGAAEHEIHRHHLDHLDVAVIPCVNDAVLDFLNGYIADNRIERLLERPLLQKGFDLGDFALFPVYMKAIAAFRPLLFVLGRRLWRLASGPTREDRLFLRCVRRFVC